ncbi:MAG: methyltransferase-like protein [Panacagrimonas sp.]|jgi:cyclopropane fatty-acyl-phospholipid synthase-like methyltransferase|nr:class I SAM-dependent methyltransferase [Panacagrimonas sp.]MCC2656466.1 methyltransferase-like protein [Panacagrimonas sp.]
MRFTLSRGADAAAGARGEFHDLADAESLNHESDGSGGRTSWGNLGYWDRPDLRYADACTALADRTVAGLELGRGTRLIDVGFGCGDQVLRWVGHYGVHEIHGLNLSHGQTALARRRLIAAGHADIAQRLEQGSATDLYAWWSSRVAAGVKADAVVALDCAYHFAPARRVFLRQAASVLRPGGRLALSDIVLARPDLSLRQRALLAGMARLSRIPSPNLLTAKGYRLQVARAGFEIERFEDATTAVFTPFGDWLDRYRAALHPSIRRDIPWTKYRATAAFLRWAEKERVLRYVVCVGKRRGK